jgi:hypothetical protein
MINVSERKKRLRKQRILRKIKLFVFLFFCSLFVGTTVWVLFFSPIFEIKQIKFSGEDPKDTATFTDYLNSAIENKSWLGLKPFLKPWLDKLSYNTKNSLFQDFPQLENDFKANFKEYSDSQISFNWWKQALNITVSKRVLAALWCDETKCGLIDTNGLYFKDLDISDKETLLADADYANYPLLEGQLKEANSIIGVGSLIVSPEIMTKLLAWYNGCKSGVIAFREISLNDSSLACFAANTNSNTKLMFNPQDDISKALLVIENLQRKTKTNANWHGLTSLNFCFYPKIYYTPDSFFIF